jgi:hypothetical protein
MQVIQRSLRREQNAMIWEENFSRGIDDLKM